MPTTRYEFGSIRSPRELYQYVVATTGVRIPHRRICADHASPFDAFSYAYGSLGPVQINWASRGFGGKTYLNALLAKVFAEQFGGGCNIMGGSERQSKLCLGYMGGFSRDPGDPGLVREILGTRVSFRNGAEVHALPASQTAARGPHPPRFIGDEIDEMDAEVLQAALGQSMSQAGSDGERVPPHNLLSSTYQNAGGTMAEYLDMADARGWPVFPWCYEETRESNGGWLPEVDITAKRETTTEAMWNTEYKLTVPSGSTLAINTQAVRTAFDASIGRFDGSPGQQVVIGGPIARPHSGGLGIDWARKRDYTCAVVMKREAGSLRCVVVGYYRQQKIGWPALIRGAAELGAAFGPVPALHDATGIGDVISAYLPISCEDLVLTNRTRAQVLGNYVVAMEHGEVVWPMIQTAFDEHRKAPQRAVLGSEDHCPDTIMAAALAYHALTAGVQPVTAQTMQVPQDAPQRGGSAWDF